MFRHWPVIVASIDDLPQSVCDGGVTGQLPGSCLPRPLQEASPERRFDTVYPVCVFGTEVNPAYILGVQCFIQV